MTTKLAPAEQRLAWLEAQGRGPGGAPVILAALEDDAPHVRDRAIRLAARYLEPTVLTQLVADGQNATRRNAGLSALERQGPYAVPHLVALLKSGDSELVMFAIQSLSRIGDTRAGPAMLPLLGHPDPNVAQAAIEAVGRFRLGEAVSTLCWLLQGDLWVQLAAIVALGEIGRPAAVGPLMKFVPDSVLAEAAVHALRRIAAPDSLEPLLRLIPTIRERGLRDQLLLTTAVVLDLHPDPGPTLARVREKSIVGSEMADYLGPLLATAPDEEDDEGQSLLRAAATLVAAIGIETLHAALLSRLATDPLAAWIEGVLRRFPDGLRPGLAELLEHPDAHLRCGALRAGTFEETDCASLAHHLSDPDARVRAAACVALGRLGIDAVAPLLFERLRAGEPVEQAAAAQGLAQLSSEALTELGSCFEHGMSEPAMVEALGILARRPVPGLDARVLHLTESPAPAVRLAALRAAAGISGTRSQVLLIRALADREPAIQREALELLVRRGGETTTVTTLMVLLGTADSLRFHVIRAVGLCHAPQAAGRLRELYPDCAPHEQAQIIRSLLRLSPPWLSDFLVQCLGDADLELRRAAAQGLAEIAATELLPILLGLAQDADWNIRNEAARGLGRLTAPEAWDALLTLARDEETVVAATARASLAQRSGDTDRTAA